MTTPTQDVPALTPHISPAASRFAEQATLRWGRVHVHSSHVTGRYDDHLLNLRFEFEPIRRGKERRGEIWFEVPGGFHTHNDSVAAAVMTLLSTTVAAATFNFPISERCATILRAYYRLSDVGPIDPSIEPRRPGRELGLNFSGGLDSVVVKQLLDEILPDGFKLITTAYGGVYAHEALGYAPHHPDVVCRTNFREQRYNAGRFNCAVPLLYADYLDLGTLTTGHAFTQNPESIESLADGGTPRFRVLEAALDAGGLGELHIARGMNEPGMVKAIAHLPDQELEQIFNGSGPPGSAKYSLRGTILRYMREAAGAPVPAFLQSVSLHPRDTRFGGMLGGVVQALYVARFIGVDAISAYAPGIEDVPAGWLASLSLDFATRYNTNFLGLLPDHLRAPLLSALNRRGIEPYREQDWSELDAVREYRWALQARATAQPVPG